MSLVNCAGYFNRLQLRGEETFFEHSSKFQKYLILANLKPISMIFAANVSSGAEVAK